MEESYGEHLASDSGLEPYAGDGNIAKRRRVELKRLVAGR